MAIPTTLTAHGATATRLAPGRWSYLAVAPSVQRGPDGAALASLLALGDTVMVQLSLQLDPPGAELEALRAELATREGRPVTLESGAGAVQGAEIVLDPDGAARTVGRSATSGYPPHTAVFSITATGGDATAWRAAFAGQRGRAAVRYIREAPAGVLARDLADALASAQPAALPTGAADPEGPPC